MGVTKDEILGGTSGYIPKENANGVLTNSLFFETNGQVGLNTITPIANTLVTFKGTSAVNTDFTFKTVNSADVNLISAANNGLVMIQSLRVGLGNNNVADNVVLGLVTSLGAITTGSRNTAIGNSQINITSESDNTSVGYGSLLLATASENTSIGSRALTFNTSGSQNTAIGFRAGNNDLVATQNSIGIGNTYVGYRASSVGNPGVDDSYYTTVIGHTATVGASGGVALGASAVITGFTSINSLALGRATTVSATNAVAIGYNTTASQANSIILGSGCDVGIGTSTPTAKLQVVGLVEYADNAAASGAGLTVGAFYRTGDLLKVVH